MLQYLPDYFKKSVRMSKFYLKILTNGFTGVWFVPQDLQVRRIYCSKRKNKQLQQSHKFIHISKKRYKFNKLPYRNAFYIVILEKLQTFCGQKQLKEFFFFYFLYKKKSDILTGFMVKIILLYHNLIILKYFFNANAFRGHPVYVVQHIRFI